VTAVDAASAEAIRLQAEEHPLVEDAPPTTPAEHVLRLMHERAYDEAVGHAAGRGVLDVGCNTGYGTMRFVPVARRVVGVDVSPRAIEAAVQRAAEGHPEFLVTDGTTLPFPDDAFDLVTSFQVIEHLEDPMPYLAELTRVVRPGGEIILATPNASIRLDPGMTPWNRFHVREFTSTELQTLLERAFTDVRVLGMFAAEPIYDTELARVDKARQRARRIAAAEARAAAPPPPPVKRSLPVRIARAVVPASLRTRLRSLVGRGPAVAPAKPAMATPASAPAVETPPVDMTAFLAFTVDDVWYAADDVDRSMDLLAVCRVDEATTPTAPTVTQGAATA
jgi:SAM-dependent methyltransferase